MKLALPVTVFLSILLGSSNLLAQAGSPSTSKKKKTAEDFFQPDDKVSLTPDQNDLGKAKELIVPGSAPIVTIDIPEIGPAPESHVLDEGRVFNAEKLAKISKLLKDPAHGLEFYITAHTMLPDENIEKYATRVRDAWATTDKCIVICYQRGSQLMTMCATDGIYRYLPRPELAKAYQAAYEEAGKHSDAADRLQVAAQAFITDVHGKLLHIEENNKVFDKGTVKLLAFLFGTLCFVGTIGFFLAKQQKKSDAHRSTTYKFPLLDLPQRYGAPFGGGMIAEIVFERPPNP